MDRDTQLPLNFEPPAELIASALECSRGGGAQRTECAANAKILHMPDAIGRALKVASAREAQLLERVLRRTNFF